MGAFLERVSKFPRIINVGDIKIDARTNQSDGSTVTAECTATTFVLLNEAAIAAANAKPAQAWRARGAEDGVTPMRTLSLTSHRSLVGRDARARAGGAARDASAGHRASRSGSCSAGAADSCWRRRKAPPSHRATPITPKAGATRSSACCAAASDSRDLRPEGRGYRRPRRRGSEPARARSPARAPSWGFVQGVDSKNYIVRVGDKLSDGTIRSITADSMVILQQVNDPLSLEKQREVRKLLRQTEEAK